MPAVENGVAVFGVSVGFFFFVSIVWPGPCEFGRLSVVLLSELDFALDFFALPIVRLIKKSQRLQTNSRQYSYSKSAFSGVCADFFR